MRMLLLIGIMTLIFSSCEKSGSCSECYVSVKSNAESLCNLRGSVFEEIARESKTMVCDGADRFKFRDEHDSKITVEFVDCTGLGQVTATIRRTAVCD